MQQRFVERAIDRLAQVVEVAAQGVRIRQTVAPDLAFDVAAADHLRRLAHQDREQAQADRRELQFLSAARHPHARGVVDQVADLQRFGAYLAALAADQRPHARFEFLDREGLHEVIVRARGQAADLVVERIARGQHQYRRGFPGFPAQLAADLEPVHARHHQVEDDGVVAVLVRKAQSVDTIARVVHSEPAAFEVFADHLGNVAVVLDHQDQAGRFVTVAHGGSFRFVKITPRGS